MNNKTADKLYKSGRILLGLHIACLVFPLTSLSSNIIDGIRENEFQWLVYYGGEFILLLAAFFLSRKYPFVAGTILIGIGVIWFVNLNIIMPPDELVGFSGMAFGFMSLCNLYPMLNGLVFLISGLIRRRNKEKELTNQ